MYRQLAALVVLLVLVGAVAPSGQRESKRDAVVEMIPDTTKSRQLGRWPNDDDLKRLQSVQGKPQHVVLHVLGHPRRVFCLPNGTQIWEYPWCAVCDVTIQHGVCTDTFYTAGY